MVRQKISTPIKDSWIFERQNSKYNRLWQQMTDCCVLIAEIVVGYVFALMAIQSLSQSALVYSFLFIVFSLTILCAILGKLDYERLKTRCILDDAILVRRQPNQPQPPILS